MTEMAHLSVPTAVGRLRRHRRVLLLAVIPAVAILAGGAGWLLTGGSVSTDDAYVKADKIAIAPRVSGKVVEVAVAENQSVAKGDLLFRIDPEPYRLALAHAEAELDGARYDIDGLKATYRQKLAELHAAENTAAYWSHEFERQQSLASQHVVSDTKIDEIRHQMDQARSQAVSLRQAMDTTAKLSSFVLFILVGSTVFGLVFRGVNGDLWVEHLMSSLPGGKLGFLVVTNVLMFVLAFFLDFFELAFILVPLLGPVAEKLGIDLIWFGVLLGVNMQTSFMHPPFGFALFYLRSVAPKADYMDKITNKLTPKITTGQIYWGAVPFVIIQIIMVGLVITFPDLVTGGIDKASAVDTSKIQIEVPQGEYGGGMYGQPDAEAK